ncbi:F-box domain-containing protein [Mycena venus]|uniref:F-box domain-containing protein n=1 Tax=Mycena venus TaxID=2733690 RepID=A0A8H6WYJ2_9AGAR|nr:F-box domain-containing protein [Mycena venus]
MAESIHLCPQCFTAFDPTESKLPPAPSVSVSRAVLESNDPPLESQIPILQDFVSMGRARMSGLNAKIAQFHSFLDDLRKESRGLAIEIRKHQGGLSPLRRLPTEILSFIFTFTDPWTVSAVCARWRVIVVSQPCFWTSIHYSDSGAFANLHTTHKFEAQLCRSGQWPLNVEFFADENADLAPGEVHILQTICKHAGRWETVSLSGPEELYRQLGRSIQGQLALLQDLKVDMVYDADEITSLDMFHDAPRLQRVSVNRGFWEFPVAMILPWSQLLRFGGSNSWDGHLHALLDATNLVDCALEITDTSAQRIPILLPCLFRLSLSDPTFLDCLETPVLLELYCGYASPVLPFLRRQACKLQKLVMWAMWEYDTPADTGDLIHIVDAAPAISNLALQPPLPDEFVRDLHSRPNMAPALEHISCALSTTDLSGSLDVQTNFVQGVESRWKSGRLKSVKVINPRFPPDLLDRMLVLQSLGLEFGGANHSIRWDAVPPELWIVSDQ